MIVEAFNHTGPMWNQIASGAMSTQASVNRAKASILSYQAVATGAITAVGAAMITHGVESAAKLQNAMATVGIVTGATARQLEALRGVVMDVSGRTAQDAVTIANEMSMAGRMSGWNPAMLSKLFPTIAMFADTRYLAQGDDPVEAVRVGTAFSHYFRTYGYNKIKGQPDILYMLDQLNRVMNVQGEDMTRVLNQGKYFIPMATNLHMSIDDVMAYTALMGQTGFLRGRGGSGMGRVLLGAINATAASAITTTAQQLRYGALYDLGMIDAKRRPLYVDDKGGIQFEALMAGLIAARQKLGAINFAVDVNKVFGTVAEQLLMTIADPQVQQQLVRIKASMHRQPDVLKQQQIYMHQTQNAWKLFATNWRNIWTNIFYPTLPALTTALTYVANAFKRAYEYIFAHPDLGWTLAISTVVTTVGAGLATMILAVRSFALQMAANAAIIRGAAGGTLAGTAGRTIAGGATAGWLSRFGIAGLFNPYTAAVVGAGAGVLGNLRYFPGGRGMAHYQSEINEARFGRPIHVNVNIDGRKVAQTVVTHMARRTPFALRAGSGSIGNPRVSAAAGGGSGFGWGN